jgi:hypothetical protein
VLKTQREDRWARRAVQRTTILPRRCPPARKLAGGTETVVNTQFGEYPFVYDLRYKVNPLGSESLLTPSIL